MIIRAMNVNAEMYILYDNIRGLSEVVWEKYEGRGRYARNYRVPSWLASEVLLALSNWTPTTCRASLIRSRERWLDLLIVHWYFGPDLLKETLWELWIPIMYLVWDEFLFSVRVSSSSPLLQIGWIRIWTCKARIVCLQTSAWQQCSCHTLGLSLLDRLHGLWSCRSLQMQQCCT